MNGRNNNRERRNPNDQNSQSYNENQNYNLNRGYDNNNNNQNQLQYSYQYNNNPSRNNGYTNGNSSRQNGNQNRNNRSNNMQNNQSQQNVHSSAQAISENLSRDISFFVGLIDQDVQEVLSKLNEIYEHQKAVSKVNGLNNVSDFIRFLLYLIKIFRDLENQNTQDAQQTILEIENHYFKFIQYTSKSINQVLDGIMNITIAYDDKAQQLLADLLEFFQFTIFEKRKHLKDIGFFHQFASVAFDFNFEIQNYDELQSEFLELKQNEQYQPEMYLQQSPTVQYDRNNPQENYLQNLDTYYEMFDKQTNVIPTHQDCINNKNYFSQLSPINPRQNYQSYNEYLKNSFSFLKADSHQGIVQGMYQMIQTAKRTKKYNGFYKYRQFQKHFNFYQNIKIKKIQFYEGLNILLQLSPVLQNNSTVLRLDLSKRLLGDQILYFTDQNLNKIIPCQVVQLQQSNQITQVLQSYNRIQIKIRVLEEKENQAHLIQSIINMVLNQSAMIIEPRNYFGHYFNTMEAIKEMITERKEIPFQNNIIHLDQKIQPPSFVKSATQYYLDFTPFSEMKENKEEEEEEQYREEAENEEEEQKIEKPKTGYKQMIMEDWKLIPTLHHLTFSQQKAIKNILTKQISLIQGPPGTGKTYVGAMAIKNIIANSDVWNQTNCPILMCCKTNHALDQFLSHIMKFEKKIVRVGSRSKIEEIKKFQLNQLRSKFKFTYESLPKMLTASRRLNYSLNQLSNSIHKCRALPEIIQQFPKQLIRNMCYQTVSQLKMFIDNFRPEEILNIPEKYDVVLKWWWQMECNVEEVMTMIVVPLIQTCVPYQFQIQQERQIKQFLIHQNKSLSLLKKFVYGEMLQLNYKSLLSFANKDGSVQEQKKEQERENQFVSMWEKIKVEGQYSVKKVEGDEEDGNNDQQEYAEDRENFHLDDSDEEEVEDYDNQEEEGEAGNSVEGNELAQQNLRYRMLKKTINQDEDFLYFTYFEFINRDYVQTFKVLMDKHDQGQLTIVDYLSFQDNNSQLDEADKKMANLFLSQQYLEHLFLRLYGVYSHYYQHDKNFLKDMSQVENFFKLCKQYEKEKADTNVQIMKGSKIVAMTLSGASKYSQLLQYLRYPIAIIEEAGEVLEQLSIPILQPFLKQLILIGDHQQLKPTPYTYLLEQKYNLNISLFERLITNKLDYVCLNHQMRMRPEFSDYVRLIYKEDGQYQDHQKVMDYPKFIGFPSNPVYYVHDFLEQAYENQTTKRNLGEAKLAIRLAKYIVSIKQFKASQITILSLYLGQSQQIKQFALQDPQVSNVCVATVDNYQGEENEVVILSLVRSERLGYLKIDNRINVAISRAKKGFIVLGNRDLIFNLEKPTKTLWDKINKKALAHNHVSNSFFQVNCPQHDTVLKFSTGTENQFGSCGGCIKPCIKQNLKCKHKCNKPCHYLDCDDHLCEEIITVNLPECNHEAKIKCHEKDTIDLDKIQCKENIVTILPCSHSGNVKCYQYNHHSEMIFPIHEKDDFNCQKECGKQMQCGHKCKEICGKHLFCNPSNCGELMNIQLECSHVFENVKCGQKLRCEKKCELILECGHQCQKKCCYEEHYCGREEVKQLECGHEAKIKCNQLKNYLCNQQFKKQLKCGHFRMVECSLKNESDDDYQCTQTVKVPQYNGSKKQMKCFENKKPEQN